LITPPLVKHVHKAADKGDVVEASAKQ